MKKMLLGFLFLFPTLVFSAEDSLTIRLDLVLHDIYSQQGDKLNGSYSVLTGTLAYNGTVRGEKINTTEDLPLDSRENKSSIAILGSSQIQFVAEDSGYKAIAAAKIEKDDGDVIKKITVAPEDYVEAVRPIIEKYGMQSLNQLGEGMEGFRVSTSLKAGEFICVPDEHDLMACVVELVIERTVQFDGKALEEKAVESTALESAQTN